LLGKRNPKTPLAESDEIKGMSNKELKGQVQNQLKSSLFT